MAFDSVYLFRFVKKKIDKCSEGRGDVKVTVIPQTACHCFGMSELACMQDDTCNDEFL